MEGMVSDICEPFLEGQAEKAAGSQVDISIVVCTRNRSQQLSKALAAISRLQFSGTWEIIVVDNGSTDATAEVVRTAAPPHHVDLTYLCEPKPGLGRARNVGLARARGGIIVFMDDDCYPAENYLQEVWPIFKDPTLGFVTGRILLHDTTDAPVTINLSENPLRFPARTFLPTGAVNGANLAFRRRTLDEIGGFDAMLGAGTPFAAEDIDAAARASRAGWDGAYCPATVVSHHHGRKPGPDIEKLYRSYDIGRGAYHMKLLLSGDVMSFLRGVYGLRWRCESYETPLREFYGGLLYLRHLLMNKRNK